MKQHFWAAFLLAFTVGSATGQQIVDQTDLEIETDSQISSPFVADLVISGGISDCFFFFNKRYDSWEGQKFRAGFQFSGLLRYPLNQYLFIETGLNLSRFGNHMDYSNTIKYRDYIDNSIKVETLKGNFEYTGYYISLPLRMQFKLTDPLSFVAGIDPAYIINLSSVDQDTLYSLNTQTYYISHFDHRQYVNPFNFILNAGMEYGLSRFSFRIQYFFGMLPVQKPEYEWEEPFRSNEIVLSVNYRFFRFPVKNSSQTSLRR